jgi:predicted membrane protein
MSDGSFLGYIALLAGSGILLAVLGIAGFGQSTLARVLDGIAALLFLGYAFYLFFIFEGGEVRIFFYAFIVPVIAVVQIFKARKARREEAAAAAQATPAEAQ